VSLWLQVRSIEAAVDELVGRGVKLVRPPAREPWGLIEAWIADPDGLRIHLVEVPEDHPLRRDQRSLTAEAGRP
jgi:predicted enzyme related to lactoylglutathione lyase